MFMEVVLFLLLNLIMNLASGFYHDQEFNFTDNYNFV